MKKTKDGSRAEWHWFCRRCWQEGFVELQEHARLQHEYTVKNTMFSGGKEHEPVFKFVRVKQFKKKKQKQGECEPLFE